MTMVTKQIPYISYQAVTTHQDKSESILSCGLAPSVIMGKKKKKNLVGWRIQTPYLFSMVSQREIGRSTTSRDNKSE